VERDLQWLVRGRVLVIDGSFNQKAFRRLNPITEKRRTVMSIQVSAVIGTYSAPDSVARRIYERAAKLDRVGMGLLRFGLIVVLCWIGGLKFAIYEADGIVPLVANSPLMSFFYHHPAPEYRRYVNKEGEVIPAHQQWHESNGTYSFSHGLGVVIVLIGVLIASYPILPQVSAVGSFLLILMSLTTLSFLVTTPEAWVPALGASTHGFPYLSGAGRLIIKDAIMLGAAVVTLADSARTWLWRNPPQRSGA
jgi:reactive chlorine resistance protein C